MITLSQRAKVWWTGGYWALKPLCATPNEVLCEFHWLRRESCQDADLLEAPQIGKENASVGHAGLAMVKRGAVLLKSGDLVKITAENPEDTPLPSMALLELQWLVKRFQALTVAPEGPDACGIDEEYPSC